MPQAKESRADQLLETATLLFKEKGYHNTSMQDLADALGLQKGSLYYYIDSKEELLRELLEQATSILGAHIDEIYAANLSASEKLRHALENHGRAIMDHLNLVTVYLQEYRSLPPERLKEVMTRREHYEHRLMQILQDGIASGEFRPVDVKMAVFGFLGMLNWTHQWFSPDGALTSEQIATILADLAMHAVSVKPDR
jgi:AcrR family transcriptional regulator